MQENLYCVGQRFINNTFRDNFDYIFKRYWVVYNDDNEKKYGIFRKAINEFEEVNTNIRITNEQVVAICDSEEDCKNLIN